MLGSYPADGVVARLPASTSSVLVLEGGQVLRWYDDGRFLEEEPEAIARESAALTALAGSGVPAPRLIAASERAPAALLMTRLAGSPDLDIPDPAAIIDLLEAIHAVRRVPRPVGRTTAITRVAIWLVPAGGATPRSGTGPSARRPRPGRTVRPCSSIATSTRATSCGAAAR